MQVQGKSCKADHPIAHPLNNLVGAWTRTGRTVLLFFAWYFRQSRQKNIEQRSTLLACRFELWKSMLRECIRLWLGPFLPNFTLYQITFGYQISINLAHTCFFGNRIQPPLTVTKEDAALMALDKDIISCNWTLASNLHNIMSLPSSNRPSSLL